MWPSVCQRIRQPRRLQLFFFRCGRLPATQETVLKVGRKQGNGGTMNLWFCLATEGGVQRKRDQSVSAFRAEASCWSPVSLAKNKPWVETRGFLPSIYLHLSLVCFIFLPSFPSLLQNHDQRQHNQVASPLLHTGEKNPPPKKTQTHLLNSSDEQGPPPNRCGALFLINPKMMLKVGEKLQEMLLSSLAVFSFSFQLFPSCVTAPQLSDLL